MDEITETRPAILVNVIDADGNVIALQIMEYEVPDFLRLRVDPEIAAGCKIVPTTKTAES